MQTFPLCCHISRGNCQNKQVLLTERFGLSFSEFGNCEWQNTDVEMSRADNGASVNDGKGGRGCWISKAPTGTATGNLRSTGLSAFESVA